MDDPVEHFVLCATNEGGRYDGYLKAAMMDRKDAYITPSKGAAVWSHLVGAYLPTFYRNTGTPELGTLDVLRCAVALADYYREHLDECTVEERIAISKRLYV